MSSGAQVAKLLQRLLAAEIAQAAVRGGNQSVRAVYIDGLTKSLLDLVDRLDSAASDSDDTENDCGRAEAGEKHVQVVVSVSILDTDLVNWRFVEGVSKFEIGASVGLGIAHLVERVGVATARMGNPRDSIADTVEAAGEMVDSMVQGDLWLAGHDRFVNLDVGAPGVGQGTNVTVDDHSEIRTEHHVISIVVVNDRVDDRHRSGDRDLHR